MFWHFFRNFIITAYAQGSHTAPPTSDDLLKLPNPLGTQNVIDILNTVWGYLWKISIPLVAIMVIIGAFQLMFAGGNEEKVTKAKKTILYAVIGFAVVLLAGSVVPLLNSLFGVN